MARNILVEPLFSTLVNSLCIPRSVGTSHLQGIKTGGSILIESNSKSNYYAEEGVFLSLGQLFGFVRHFKLKVDDTVTIPFRLFNNASNCLSVKILLHYNGSITVTVNVVRYHIDEFPYIIDRDKLPVDAEAIPTGNGGARVLYYSESKKSTYLVLHKSVDSITKVRKLLSSFVHRPAYSKSNDVTVIPASYIELYNVEAVAGEVIKLDPVDILDVTNLD